MDILNILSYSLLFMILQPGSLINFYPGNKGYFLSQQTSYTSIIIHAFILAFTLVLINGKNNKNNNNDVINQVNKINRIDNTDLIHIIIIILFILLSPGLILTIPSKNMFFTLETNYTSIITHTVIFMFIYGLSTIYIKKKKNKNIVL
jgi:hypothetical protein